MGSIHPVALVDVLTSALNLKKKSDGRTGPWQSLASLGSCSFGDLLRFADFGGDLPLLAGALARGSLPVRGRSRKVVVPSALGVLATGPCTICHVSMFFPKTPLGLGSRLVLQREVRDIGPCLDGRALED